LRTCAGCHPDIHTTTTTRFNLVFFLFRTLATLRLARNPFTLAWLTAIFAFLLTRLALLHFARSAALNNGVGKFIQNWRIEICAGFFHKLFTKLITQNAAANFTHTTFFKIAKLERTKRNADQAPNGQAQCTENVFNFAVLAFAQTNRNPDIRALLTLKRRFNAAIEDAINGDAVFQLVKLRLRDLAMGADAIATQPAGRRQFQNARQTTIIGEQKQTFRIDIETTDGKHTRHFGRQRFKYGRAAFRVTVGGHKASRLVIKPQTRALSLLQLLAIDCDDIRALYVDRRCIEHLAVHRNTACRDHGLGFAARSNTGTRQTLGDAFTAIFTILRVARSKFARRTALIVTARPIIAGLAIAKIIVAGAGASLAAFATRTAWAITAAFATSMRGTSTALIVVFCAHLVLAFQQRRRVVFRPFETGKELSGQKRRINPFVNRF
jgi:hypothetical protein